MLKLKHLMLYLWWCAPVATHGYFASIYNMGAYPMQTTTAVQTMQTFIYTTYSPSDGWPARAVLFAFTRPPALIIVLRIAPHAQHLRQICENPLASVVLPNRSSSNSSDSPPPPQKTLPERVLAPPPCAPALPPERVPAAPTGGHASVLRGAALPGMLSPARLLVERQRVQMALLRLRTNHSYGVRRHGASDGERAHNSSSCNLEILFGLLIVVPVLRKLLSLRKGVYFSIWLLSDTDLSTISIVESLRPQASLIS